MPDQNPLLMLALVPVIAGIVVVFLPDRLKYVSRAAALIISAWAFAGVIRLFFKAPMPWSCSGITIFAADNLSLLAAAGIGLFGLVVSVYSVGYIEKAFGRYFGYLLMTLGSSFGAVFSVNMLVLAVFWGSLAVLLYLMVSIYPSDKAAAAAKKALIIVGGTDALMLFGMALVWQITGKLDMTAIRLEMVWPGPLLAYLALAVASFAKSGAMPFHSWLPDVAEYAPAPVTAYLPASLDKLLGIYLLARISMHLFVMNNVSNFILALVGAVTIIVAVMMALVQHDMKRLLGYHAVSQVGYMVLGIGTGTAIGLAGGLFHMLNHAIYKSCLFLCAGNVEKRTHRTDLDRLGGLARYMPLTFVSFLVASLSISGIPPFNGFVSKWMIYQGIIGSATPGNPLWILLLVAAMFGSALTVASFMKLLHAVFLGRPAKDMEEIKEVSLSMALPVALLAAICIIFGILAFKIPLPMLILPAISFQVVYSGTWSPVAATILLLAGIGLGLLVYAVFRSGAFRTSGSFVGGEDPQIFERVTGTEFYNTINDLKPVGALYKKEGALDPYNLARRLIYPLTDYLKHLHNGILPTYLIWCVLGLLGIILYLFLKA